MARERSDRGLSCRARFLLRLCSRRPSTDRRPPRRSTSCAHSTRHRPCASKGRGPTNYEPPPELPKAWRQDHGIRRYGFHGASHRYVSGRAAEFLGKDAAELRIISCHLGGSASICAVRGGESVDVSMGFSPQSGLENATRHGDLDPFAVLFLMDRLGWSTAEAREHLLSEGGLAGISGIPGGDLRDLEIASEQGSEDATLALETFAYEIRKTVGAFAAAMGGVDAIVFTGGIGENSAWLRKHALTGLEFFGVRVGAVRNVGETGDRAISPSRARVSVLVLATNEEIVVARETARVLGA